MDTQQLNDGIINFLNPEPWSDIRNLGTFSDLVCSSILTKTLTIPDWIPFMSGKAVFAQSKERRIRRWIGNQRITPQKIYRPLIREALKDWGRDNRLYLAFDTCMLWNTYCMLRVSVIYRGRAIALDWKVLEHKSSAVSYEAYEAFLKGIPSLLPAGVEVVFLADRGFADTQLMELCTSLNWCYRIRIKETFTVFLEDGSSKKVEELMPKKGRAHILHNVSLTKKMYGPVHLALGKHGSSKDKWMIASDKKTDLQSFKEYGNRFDIEEEFLDDKSNGFQLEASKLRDACDLERLLLIMATAKLFLVSQGEEVVREKKDDGLILIGPEA